MRTLAIRGVAVFLALYAASAGSFAQDLPNTTAMSCKSAAGLVAARGAIVLATGPITYDRFVADRGFCQADEDTKPGFVPTLDSRQCFVGYYCYQPSLNSNK
jgi:hypothetical protein